ncbi:unnamed protein product [Meloidogyne enterolobii]|uniref:Uncharacterized protein n=1 Tax=Meloidogyne enterolobii TaxID=390850 RepID=A0ACB1A4G9_MELEN
MCPFFYCILVKKREKVCRIGTGSLCTAVCVPPFVYGRLCTAVCVPGRLCTGRLCTAGCVPTQRGTFVYPHYFLDFFLFF